jgi:hypothetical protein
LILRANLVGAQGLIAWKLDGAVVATLARDSIVTSRGDVYWRRRMLQ